MLCRYAECVYAECHYAYFNYAEFHYVECHYAECHYAEYRGALLGSIPLAFTLPGVRLGVHAQSLATKGAPQR